MSAPVWARETAVLWRNLADGVLLLAPGGDRLVALSGANALLWDALDAPMTAQELVDRLTPGNVDDVSSALRELAAVGAVRESSP